MNKEILQVAEAVSNEKDVPKAVIFEAMEVALATATRKRYDEDADIRVVIDRATGDYETWRRWRVVGNDEVPALGTELTLEEAEQIDPNLKPGDIWEEKIESVKFGRIAAQTAKQVIVQKVREAERAKVVEQYQDRKGELLAGTVKKVTRDNVIVDLGNNAEALLPRENLIPRESYRMGDRVRAVLEEVRGEGRGPQLVLSRPSNAMLIELFCICVNRRSADTPTTSASCLTVTSAIYVFSSPAGGYCSCANQGARAVMISSAAFSSVRPSTSSRSSTACSARSSMVTMPWAAS